ncbi:Phosphoserine aminotransferase [Diplonema papillatum]|nr:Phosphoserine aminotransferase [Diplonema papillatum]
MPNATRPQHISYTLFPRPPPLTCSYHSFDPFPLAVVSLLSLSGENVPCDATEATLAPPSFKPLNPNLGSGPCSKRPGFNEFRDDSKVLGRSHRTGLCKKRINLATAETLRLLGCPATYQAGFLHAPVVEQLAWARVLGRGAGDRLPPTNPQPRHRRLQPATAVEKNLVEKAKTELLDFC